MAPTKWSVLMRTEMRSDGEFEPYSVDYEPTSYRAWRNNHPQYVACDPNTPMHERITLFEDVELSTDGLDLIERLGVEQIGNDLRDLLNAAFSLGRKYEQKTQGGKKIAPGFCYIHKIRR